MKKGLLVGMTVFLISLSAIVMASDNGNMLSKEEGAAHQFMEGLSSDTVQVSKLQSIMAPQIAAKVNDKWIAATQQALKNKFGTQKEIKFASYQRANQGDFVIYMASYEKAPVVRIVFQFDGKDDVQIQSFAYSIVNKPTAPVPATK